MAPYDDWNKIDDEDDEELQDASLYESKKDVILFCIDCSESMLAPYEDPKYEDVQTCHLLAALEAAVEIQKRKIIVGPNDLVGILLFNTTRKSEVKRSQASEIKKNTFLFQTIEPLSAPTVQELIQLIDASREDLGHLRNTFPPLQGARVPLGDVFTSCNWVLRDGAPKAATKRVFLITDEDNPIPNNSASRQLTTSARTTLIDLTQAGVAVEPFFISTDAKPFNVSNFYSSVLLTTNILSEDQLQDDPGILPESISISRIEDLLAQMRIHEVPKRAQYSIPFHLANGLTIGVKGYGLVTEQKKGAYKYFVDLGDRMEVVQVRTNYVDEDRQADVERKKIVFGAELGGAPSGDDENEESSKFGVRAVQTGNRPFYTPEEVRSFRTLGLEPGLKLLGFKDRGTLQFQDNIKHSQFIYPDEMAYSGSRRTFVALLKSMIQKDKIALALALTRRNSSPIFCALVPQEERVDEEGGWTDPAGFHLVPLPFADDIRSPPIEEGFRASAEMQDAARLWIDKLAVKNGTYPPDSYPNPALAYHNAQLQASAFREEYDPDSFEDLTEPKLDMIHKRAGNLMKEWKETLVTDNSANLITPAATGSKRKATDISVDETEFRNHYDRGTLAKLRVDELKEFLRSKGAAVSGKKADLIERMSDWFQAH